MCIFIRTVHNTLKRPAAVGVQILTSLANSLVNIILAQKGEKYTAQSPKHGFDFVISRSFSRIRLGLVSPQVGS